MSKTKKILKYFLRPENLCFRGFATLAASYGVSNPDFKMNMTSIIKTSPLETLCQLLPREELHGEEVIFIYQHLFDTKRSFPLHHYLKNFKDIFTKISLERITRKYPELKIEGLDGEHKNNSEKYIFTRDAIQRVYVHSSKNRRILAVYENLVRVDGIPTIIESSVTKFPKVCPDKIKILHKALGVSPQYIMVSPPEHLAALNAQYFQRLGGLIALFSISETAFKETVEGLIQGTGLKYTKL